MRPAVTMYRSTMYYTSPPPPPPSWGRRVALALALALVFSFSSDHPGKLLLTACAARHVRAETVTDMRTVAHVSRVVVKVRPYNPYQGLRDSISCFSLLRLSCAD